MDERGRGVPEPSPAAKRMAERTIQPLWKSKQTWAGTSINQDVYAMARLAPTTFSDTPEQERAAGTKRLRLFFGLEVDDKTGNVDPVLDRHPVYQAMSSRLVEVDAFMQNLEQSVVEHYGLEGLHALYSTSGVAMSAPRLGHTRQLIRDPALRTLMNGSREVVVKAYPITKLIMDEDDESEQRKQLLGIIHSIMVGNALNELMSHYSTSITPHFVRLMDWTLGPTITSRTGALNYRQIQQYVIEESAGKYTLSNLGATLPLGAYVTSTFQLLHALEAFQLTMGGIHGDLHAGNFHYRMLVPGENAYANAPLAYGRPNIPGFVVLPPEMHQNYFPSILDFGYTRCFVPSTEDHYKGNAHEHRVLVGVEDGHYKNEQHLEHFAQARRTAHWTRDVQTLGHILLTVVSFDDLKRRAQAREPEVYKNFFQKFVSLVGCMVHTRYYMAVLLHALKKRNATVVASEVTPTARAQLQAAWDLLYSGSLKHVDQVGSIAHFNATMILNRMLTDPKDSSLRALAHSCIYKYMATDRSANMRAKLLAPGGIVDVPTPSECLDFSIWDPLKSSPDLQIPLPQGTVLAGIVLPSQVMRDPLRNDPSIADNDIPVGYRRFLPRVFVTRKTVVRRGAFAPPLDDTDDEEESVSVTNTQTLLGKHAPAEETTTTSTKSPCCVLCEQPALLTLSENPGLVVCSALCGQMYLMRQELDAKVPMQ